MLSDRPGQFAEAVVDHPAQKALHVENAVEEKKTLSAAIKSVEELTGVIGHTDPAAPLRDCCTGLLAAEGGRSVEPMAAVTAPCRVSVQHQKLLHFVGEGKWSDERVLAKVREMVVPAIERHGPIKAWIVDDTVINSWRASSS